ncbi:hypothetical protein DBT_1926 [Dissulfuribacter thermophilus]|uniref:Uncharacterized protein n=1 Tax=Dissulfuribacter thermophilus TaxID=1156395 RepID=A0A1B9F4E5_9BACT|nr:hypothetical protein DBT_1926 [Dissulfuribacter thermophilus]
MACPLYFFRLFRFFLLKQSYRLKKSEAEVHGFFISPLLISK